MFKPSPEGLKAQTPGRIQKVEPPPQISNHARSNYDPKPKPETLKGSFLGILKEIYLWGGVFEGTGIEVFQGAPVGVPK